MPKKVLIVDDNPDIVELITTRLEANEYIVVTAGGGQEALDKVVGEQPDLVLLDIAMPGMDGFEVGKKLKENEQTQGIPIIMVTAKGAHKDVMRAINEAQVIDYIVKPFRPNVLLEKVAKALGQE